MDLKDKLIQAVEDAIEVWEDLREDKKLDVNLVFALISSLVLTAEAVVKEAKQGEIKHKAVREAFDYFDEKYNLIDRLDEIIKLPFWLEPFDGKLLKALIDLLIVQAVSMMNMS